MIYINKCLLTYCKHKDSINAILYDKLEDVNPSSIDYVFGSVSDIKKLQLRGQTYFDNIKVTDWLAFLKTEYINYDGYFKQVWQINKNDYGKFCRSNSGGKEWSGQILKNEIDHQTIKQLVMEDELLYFASAKNIINEKRFWIANSKIIGYSHYYNKFCNKFNVECNHEEAVQYVEKIIDIYYEPNHYYTIDIGFDIDQNKFKVIEYNAFNTSGFYNADVNTIINVER